jgi:hypothetical protein
MILLTFFDKSNNFTKIINKKGRWEMVGAGVPFFGKRGVRLGLVVEGEDGHLGLALELSIRLHTLFSVGVSS